MFAGWDKRTSLFQLSVNGEEKKLKHPLLARGKMGLQYFSPLPEPNTIKLFTIVN
jgi:hypothetical protein